MTKVQKINNFRKLIERKFRENPLGCEPDFGVILCYEIHLQPINPRMYFNDKGLTFKELANKWGISNTFLGELIADHCKNFDEIFKD